VAGCALRSRRSHMSLSQSVFRVLHCCSSDARRYACTCSALPGSPSTAAWRNAFGNASPPPPIDATGSFIDTYLMRVDERMMRALRCKNYGGHAEPTSGIPENCASSWNRIVKASSSMTFLCRPSAAVRLQLHRQRPHQQTLVSSLLQD